ncbi:YppF family protein [Peribacillus loiseleuriae]|uniref:YppF-like protein n=1 Tax=Peribacillus loiseleuriae TaxID=1679170 RepID=A0A0K9G817_9BACI|nr:YppF family protein [Peribacillus loiseleuriae]KMY42798.1 hypothetical protein AC625_24430 [Peribacillus loiseleuriae]
MLVEGLIHHFQLVKKRTPLNVNELLDYIQKSYIYGELSIVEYKKHFFELNKLGAEKPISFFENIRSLDFENAN